MVKPYILRFAKRCMSPSRANMIPNKDYEYDESIDMVRCISTPLKELAIDSENESGPTTKKNDIEKGEDNKDRLMWS